MKTSQLYSSIVGMYLFSAMVSVLGVPITISGWSFNANPILGTVVTVAFGATCVAAGTVNCLIAGVAALLTLVVGSFKAQGTGQRGGGMLPIHNKRGGSDFQVWHDIGDGHVRDYLDTSALKVGIDHVVWDSRGNVFTASKHAKTGDNILTVHLGGKLEDTPLGRRVVKASDDRLDARQTKTEVDSFAASWSYSGTAYDAYSDDAAQADAQEVVYDLFGGSNREELLAPYECTTLSPSNGDDEKANISITPMGPGLSSEIEPACGA